MKQAFITELAECDMAKIWAYIANDNPGVADRFIAQLRWQCHKLAAAPGAGRPRPDLAENIRSYAIGNYLVF